MTAHLTLGPVFFNWQPERWRDFYFRIAAEAPVDIVHVGEVVCAKRAPFFAPHLESVVQRLRDAGKKVVLSSLALIGNEREAAAMQALCEADGLLVEANDIGLIRLFGGRPHVLGPFINVYNEGTLAYMARQGAVRACLPPELPAASIASLAATTPIELEVMAFGRLPLAISARCFHARAHHLHKDGCQFICARDPNGLVIDTLDGEPFLAINGTQTLSHTCCNLLDDLASLRAAGIGRFRLSPMAVDMVAVAELFRAVLDERLDAAEANSTLANLVPGTPFANGFLHGVAGRTFDHAALE